MSTTLSTMTDWLLGASALLAAALPVQAQAERERPLVRPEVRGIIKSIDAGAGAITLAAFEGRQPAPEKTYTLAKDAELAVGDGSGRRGALKAIKLADLTPGVQVSLSLTADQQTVDGLLAEGPVVRGLLKSVDAAKNTLSVALPQGRNEGGPGEKTFNVAANAEIAVDDGRGRRSSVKESKLTELAAGAFVTLWLSVDQKQVHIVVAEGPMVMGRVKHVDAGKNSLTVLTNPGRDGDAEEKTLEVIKDASILLDDGRGRRLSLKEGKLADILAGSTIAAKLSVDHNSVTSLRVEGPSLPGMVKAVDAEKGTITIMTRVSRTDDPEEKTLTLAKDARIMIEGNAAKLADIRVEDNGPFVMVRLSLDQKTVQLVVVNRGR